MKSVGLAVAAALAAAAFGQERKPDTPERPSMITVEGCIRGSVLALPGNRNTNRGGGVLSASEFIIDGAREMVQTLKNSHDGHYMELTGEVKRPPTPANEKVKVETRDLGRAGRITIGTRQHAGLIQSVPQPVRIIVDSFKHISEKCLER